MAGVDSLASFSLPIRDGLMCRSTWLPVLPQGRAFEIFEFALADPQLGRLGVRD